MLFNLKEVGTARNPSEIITTTESIFGILEAISSLQQNDQLQLPVDSMNQLFRAVRLKPMEKISVLDFVRRKIGVPLCEIRDWVRSCYQDYSLVQQTLKQAEKDYNTGHEGNGALPKTWTWTWTKAMNINPRAQGEGEEKRP